MPNQQRQRGFTLIEIMVVVIIVGTITSIALLSLGVIGEDEQLDTERRRLMTLIEMVQDDALLQGREFGIEIMTSSYRFVEFDPLARQWAEVFGDDIYQARTLPEGLEFSLYIDDKLIPLEENPQELDDPDGAPNASGIDPFTPHLFIFASGEASAYEIRFHRPQTDGELIMHGDILGKIRFGEDDEI